MQRPKEIKQTDDPWTAKRFSYVCEKNSRTWTKERSNTRTGAAELRLMFKFNVALRPQTVRTIRDGEPRTATSTFTQLLSFVRLSSSSELLYVHRGHEGLLRTGAQDGHVDFHTAPELWETEETTATLQLYERTGQLQ